MVAAGRKEKPALVDVRFSVRSALERMPRMGMNNEDLDWIGALLNLFSSNFVKLSVAAAFLCMLAVDISTSLNDTEIQSENNDPLITLYSGEAEWSDWL